MSTGTKIFAFVLIILAIGLINSIMSDSGSQNSNQSRMQKIQNSVAHDIEQQYEIAKTGGDKIDIYVHAGMVAAAYLQAKDQENYLKWKAIEKEDGLRAGIRK